MKKSRIVFLGGIFPDSQIDYIRKNSSGVIQNAADALQKKLIHGFDAQVNDGVLVLNLPFVGSFPKLFRKIYFPGGVEKFGLNTSVVSIGFVNLIFLKIVFRFVAAFFALLRFCRKGDIVLFVYSAHLPFVLSSVFVRWFNPLIKICIIIPDLPMYMGDGGFLYRLLKRFDSLIFKFFVKKLDYFVLLTKHMGQELDLAEDKFVVIEGIASEFKSAPLGSDESGSCPKYFLYSGTLALRYGIGDLVDAFLKVQNPDVELWICGDGDGKEYVSSVALLDSRIKYIGQIGREVVLSMQSKAFILVNPRSPEGEYTKFSFPSKIMEYMASGRPVIMYSLQGIPDEYSPYYIAPDSVGVDALSECMSNVIEWSDDKLADFGCRAREFILHKKNPLAQTGKILNLVMENH